MTKSGRTARLPLIAAAGILVLICAAFQMSRSTPGLTMTTNSLPTAQPTCVVTPAVFATWFHSGAPTLNGLVDPANSVIFPNNNPLPPLPLPIALSMSGRSRCFCGLLRPLDTGV
jgi:hypothetical protein